MASNEIKIIIGGDAQGFVNAATQVDNALSRKIVPKTKAAGAAILDLSRIVQDAPFAFQNFGSIANNIDPAFISMGRLREEAARLSAETGKNVSAFQLFGKALLGGAGIGLAISTVTSLITVAQQRFGGVGNAISALLGSYTALDQANDELAKSFTEAAGKAAGEQAVINSLVGVARNEALSRDARQEAINKLNKEYDEFLPKLTLENINTQAVTDSVNKLNEALLRQAKIKGVQELISKEFQKLTETLSSAPQESLGFFDKLGTVITGLGDPAKTLTDQVTKGLERQGEAANEAKQRIALFTKTLNDLITTEATEGTLFTESNKKGTDALKERIDQLKKLQALAGLSVKQQVELAQLEIQLVQRDAGKLKMSKEDVQSAIDTIIRRAFPDDFKMTVAARLDIVPTTEKPDISKALGLDKIDTGKLDEAMERIRKQAAASARANLSGSEIGLAFAESIVNGLEQASSTIGEAFGSILSGEGIGQSLAKAAQGILSIIGSVLQDIGKQIIATSVAVQALKKALASLFSNPALALGAGLALIALGGVLKNIKFDLPKFQDGGITSGPSSGFPAILHPDEAIIPLNKLPDIVGRIKGGGNDITLAPVVSFGYDKLLIGLQRIESRRARLG